MKSSRTYYLLRFFAYAFAFGMIAEWLQPILQATKSGYYAVFLSFVGVSLFLYFIRLPFFLSIPVKTAFILFFPFVIFYHSAYTFKAFVLYWKEQWVLNIEAIFTESAQPLTNDCQTLFFFIVLWAFTYFVYYWIDELRRVNLFVVVTLVFFSAMPLFNVPVQSWAFIRIVLYSVGLLFTVKWLRRWLNDTVLWKRRDFYKNVGVFSIATVLTVVATLFVVPFDPVTNDWSEVLQWSKKKEAAMSGYREHDDQLGGAVKDNHAPVMTVDTADRHYYRLEVRDYYTSKGWRTEREKQIEDVPVTQTGKDEEMTITFHRTWPYVPVVYGMTSIKDGPSLKRLPLYEQYFFEEANDWPEQMTYTYQQRIYDETYLRTLDDESFDLTKDEQAMYTQLPEQLPARLYDLAEQITKDAPTTYDRVRAIESYFTEAGYRYEKKDVPYPEKDEDYVDQFVFETKKGYCDNYSSSMVVLLRTLDIPARWAKGYASGTYDSETGTTLITENDAHSWVEVYFPTLGWIPFEPTVGFDAPTQFERTVDLEEATEEQLEEGEVDVPNAEKTEEQAASEAEEEVIEKEEKERRFNWQLFFLAMIVGLLVIGGVIAFGYYKKKKEVDSVTSFERRYQQLLRLLEKKGWSRASSETLQQFARRVDEDFETTRLVELTSYYEQCIYSDETALEDWSVYEESFNWYEHRLRVDLSNKEK